jgi:uncharacterized protein (DUF4415 family)
MAYRMTKNERIARERLTYHLWRMQEDEATLDFELRWAAPNAWHTLELDLDCEEPKEKVTLYLDRSVARAFKAMGKGYHARINRLLATWLQFKLSGKFEANSALTAREMDLHRKTRYAREMGIKHPTLDADLAEWPTPKIEDL